MHRICQPEGNKEEVIKNQKNLNNYNPIKEATSSTKNMHIDFQTHAKRTIVRPYTAKPRSPVGSDMKRVDILERMEMDTVNRQRRHLEAVASAKEEEEKQMRECTF